jgi:hypothetical protein
LTHLALFRFAFVLLILRLFVLLLALDAEVAEIKLAVNVAKFVEVLALAWARGPEVLAAYGGEAAAVPSVMVKFKSEGEVRALRGGNSMNEASEFRYAGEMMKLHQSNTALGLTVC